MSAPPLHGVLAHLRRRLAGFLGLMVLLSLGSVIGWTAIAAILLDVIVILPDRARAMAPWALGLGAAATALAGILGLRRLNEARIARRFEREDRALGSVLINAVQLSSQRSGSAAEEVLRVEAVELGRRRSSGLPAWPVVRRGVTVSGVVAALAVLSWAGGWVLCGDVFRAVVPRFLDPFGDHPPYSRLRIEVTPGDTAVLYGGQCEIKATAVGLPADKLFLAARSGNEETQTVMFVSPDRTFFQTLANLREETEYFVTNGRARSRRFKIAIQYTPKITLVQTRTEFPGYTHMAARTANLTDEALCLPLDSRVALRVASNRPLASGELTLTPILGGATKTVPLKTDTPDSVVTGSFSVTEPAAFTITVTDVAGLVCAEPRKGRVNILPDNRPQIFVLEPGRHAVATPEVSVPVCVQAEDDYAVTQVLWFRGLNKSIERPFRMKLRPLSSQAQASSVEARGAFDLRELGVRPGDEITYFFEAVDNYPKGPNLVTSRMFTLRIISVEEYREILRRMAAQKALFESYEKLGAWLRRLAERAGELDKMAKEAEKGAPGAAQEAVRKSAKELAEEIAKYQAEVAQALARGTLFDVEKAFHDTLKGQQDALDGLKAPLAGLTAPGGVSVKDTRRIAEALAGLCRREQAEIAEPVRLIKAVVRVLARANAFVVIAQRQAEVARLGERFKDRAEGLSVVEQMELQEIAHAEQQVRDALNELVTELPRLLADVPDEEKYAILKKTAGDFLAAVAEAKIQEDLDEAAVGFGALDGRRGFPPAQRAAENMDKLIKRCHPMAGIGKQCLVAFSPTMTEIGNTLDQILAAMGKGGYGAAGSDGNSLLADEVGLYGPDFELAGRPTSGRGPDAGGIPGKGRDRSAGDVRDTDRLGPKASEHVKLQRDVKFPLRYRNLVGEYFRVIAESQAE